MTPRTLAAALVALALPAAGPAQGPAQAGPPAAPAGITYDCDTASDHFSELVLPAPAGPFEVTGRVRLNRIAAIGTYAPLTRVAVTEAGAPGAAPADSAGFELTALPAKAVHLPGKGAAQFLQWDERVGGTARVHPPQGPLDDADALAFRLAFDGAAVSARVGPHEQRMAATLHSPVVRLVCSTGEFLFTDLRIGRMG